MFGYVKPDSGELRVKDYDFYRATYCGICRETGRVTGNASRIALSYDAVFLALVRMLFIGEEEFSSRMRRCAVHPLKKRNMLDPNPAITYTARVFALLSYHKLRDDLSDEGALTRTAALPLRPILAHARARAGYAALDRLMAEKLSEISEMERAKLARVDPPASLFGDLLGAVFASGLPEREGRVTREIGYRLGKFIYAADAAEDYEKDLRRGRYNPYVLSYGGKPLTRENRETIRTALLLEASRMARAVELLPFGNRRILENLIKNITYRGLVRRIAFLTDGEDEKKLTPSEERKPET